MIFSAIVLSITRLSPLNTLQNIRNASALGSKIKGKDGGRLDNKENERLLDSEINTLTVNQLKDYLRRHNLLSSSSRSLTRPVQQQLVVFIRSSKPPYNFWWHNQNGTEKKADLALCAKGVSKLVNTDVICGKAAAGQFERRQTEKLVTPLGEKLPAPFSLVN